MSEEELNLEAIKEILAKNDITKLANIEDIMFELKTYKQCLVRLDQCPYDPEIVVVIGLIYKWIAQCEYKLTEKERKEELKRMEERSLKQIEKQKIEDEARAKRLKDRTPIQKPIQTVTIVRESAYIGPRKAGKIFEDFIQNYRSR